MFLKDVRPGTVVYSVEPIGDDKSGMEIREVFYLRGPDDVSCKHAHNVRVARIGVAQGDPMLPESPRYHRFGELCRDPGEADGRIRVFEVFQGNSRWGSEFMEHLKSAAAQE